MSLARKIMVVDDEPDLLDIVGFHLRSLGHEVTAFSDGATALSFLETGAPLDLVLTDIRMPGITGLEICRHVRTQRPRCAIAVMSGFSDVDAELRALGVTSILRKPFEWEEIDRLLAAVA